MKYYEVQMGQRVRVVHTYYKRSLRGRTGSVISRYGGNVRVRFSAAPWDYIDIKPSNLCPVGIIINPTVPIEDVI